MTRRDDNGTAVPPPSAIADEATLHTVYEQLRTFYESASIVGELDLEVSLPKFLDAAFEVLAGKRGAILLADDEGNMVPRFVKTAGDNDQTSVLRSLLVEAQKTREPTLSSSSESGHSIAVPIVHADEVLGIIYVDTADHSPSGRELAIAFAWPAWSVWRSRARAWPRGSKKKPIPARSTAGSFRPT